jgi:hypothetical protein
MAWMAAAYPLTQSQSGINATIQYDDSGACPRQEQLSNTTPAPGDKI